MIKLKKILTEDINKISPLKFRWDNSSRATYTSITSLWNYKTLKPLAPVIGYCDGDKVEISPQPKTYAVMFDFEGEEVWVHISKEEFDGYLR